MVFCVTSPTPWKLNEVPKWIFQCSQKSEPEFREVCWSVLWHISYERTYLERAIKPKQDVLKILKLLKFPV